MPPHRSIKARRALPVLTAALVLVIPGGSRGLPATDTRSASAGARAARSDPDRIGGLLLEVRDGRLLIAGIEPDSPAADAGILPGDRILILNGVSLIDLDAVAPRDAIELVTSSASPEIRLVLGRGAGTLGVVIPRAAPALPRSPVDPPEIGVEAPAFTAIGLDGEEIRLDALRGRPVLIDFWASWCPPCRGAALTLRRIALEHDDRLAVIGVSLDDDRPSYEAFVYNNHLPGHQVLDGGWYGPISTGYGIAAVGIPYAVLVGRDGRVAARGPSLSELEDEIARRAANPPRESE